MSTRRPPAARRVTLVASKDLVHNGRAFSAGETFEASPLDAAALTYQKKATFLGTKRVSVDPLELRRAQADVADRVMESAPAKVRAAVRRKAPPKPPEDVEMPSVEDLDADA